jgi:hypothetical protein
MNNKKKLERVANLMEEARELKKKNKYITIKDQRWLMEEYKTALAAGDEILKNGIYDVLYFTFHDYGKKIMGRYNIEQAAAIDEDDMEQAFNIALVVALDKYDPQKAKTAPISFITTYILKEFHKRACEQLAAMMTGSKT